MHQETEQYLPLVRSIARTVKCSLPDSIELDDLISEGVLALDSALYSFDATRGATFTTYAWYRIRGAILDSVRAEYRHSMRHAELSDDIPAASPDPDTRIAAQQSMRTLNARQNSVIRERYFSGCQKRETGRRLGISEQWVGVLERQSLTQMRAAA